MTAKPFVKWVGGKRGVIKKLLPLTPKKIKNYYEPFVGGGALFFNIYERAEYCHISDVNEDLIHCYRIVRDRLPELVAQLKIHAANHSKDYYFLIRSQRELQDEIERAARFIYLLKTCYNGLYRVNNNNHFNSSPGINKIYNICDEETLTAASQALSKTSIKTQDFSQISPQEGDFVYLDPPYFNNFNRYHNVSFKQADHVRLKDFALQLGQQGANVMISNSDNPFVESIYANFNIVKISAPRLLSCKAETRKPTYEIVAVNYTLDENL